MSNTGICFVEKIKDRQNHVLEGGILFKEEGEITPEVYNNPRAKQLCRESIRQELYHQVFDWMKEEYPYELASYINLEARDLAMEYLRL